MKADDLVYKRHLCARMFDREQTYAAGAVGSYLSHILGKILTRLANATHSRPPSSWMTTR